MGQLSSFYKDFQSNFWVHLRILGQPCEFYLMGGASLGGWMGGARSFAELVPALRALARVLEASGRPFFGGAHPHIGDFGAFKQADNWSRLAPAQHASLGGAWATWHRRMPRGPAARGRASTCTSKAGRAPRTPRGTRMLATLGASSPASKTPAKERRARRRRGCDSWIKQMCCVCRVLSLLKLQPCVAGLSPTGSYLNATPNNLPTPNTTITNPHHSV